MNNEPQAFTLNGVFYAAVIGTVIGIAFVGGIIFNHYTEKREPIKVYMCEGVMEDNLYVSDKDIGKVDFVPENNVCE